MGAGQSTEAFDFDEQLLNDTAVYAQMVPSEGDDAATGNEDSTAILRNVDAKDGVVNFKIGCETVWELFQHGFKKFPEADCYGTRSFEYGEDGKVTRGPYQWLSYAQVDERARNAGLGLRALGLNSGDNIGIYAVNRTEWMLTALGAYSQGIRVVALYSTLGEEAVEYIINHSEVKAVFVSAENMKTLLHDITKLPSVTHVVQFDASADYNNKNDVIAPEAMTACQEAGKTLLGFEEILQKGKDNSTIESTPPTGGDLALIMYTSGTTGTPKGVMLAHESLATASYPLPGLETGVGDRHYSYLPLAHSFETIVQASSLANGVAIGYFQGNIAKLTDDLAALKPTIMAGVPRVFAKMYDKVFDGVKDKFCLIRYIFHKYYSEQCAAVRTGDRIEKYDSVLLGIRDKIGMSEIRGIVTGGAPCPPYLLEFLKVIMGCVVLQGYGLTETAAALTVTDGQDNTIGHVGAPRSWAEIRLKSVPEMGYSATDMPPRGEVQIRGKGLFKGYYKNEEATKEAFDGDWFCSGDIGRINNNGTISIIDRKKNILKLSQGEYVALEKVENTYAQSAFVNQIFVYGNSYKSVLVAVVVPSADAILRVAHENGLWKNNSPVGSPAFRAEFREVFEANKELLSKLVRADMKAFEGSLKGFEKVKVVHYETEIDEQMIGFTVENDCLTPTFKLRRPFCKTRYMDVLKKMYTDFGDAPKDDERW